MNSLRTAIYMGVLAVVIAVTAAERASAELVAYWSFDNNSEMARTQGNQGTLDVSPEGWFTDKDFPTGGTTINRINYGQTSYEYMRIHDPISLFTVGVIKITGLDFTGLSGVQLSFAAHISDFISLEVGRDAVCYINDAEVSRQPFDVSTGGWALVSIDLLAAIDNQSNVRIELQFDDKINVAYNLNVDNIQLTAIPEPFTTSMLLLACGFCSLRRRRK